MSNINNCTSFWLDSIFKGLLLLPTSLHKVRSVFKCKQHTNLATLEVINCLVSGKYTQLWIIVLFVEAGFILEQFLNIVIPSFFLFAHSNTVRKTYIAKGLQN